MTSLFFLQVMKSVFIVVVVALILRGGDSRGVTKAKPKAPKKFESFEYSAMNCRAHSASLTEFGGVGDGKTSNTKAFQTAISKLSQYATDGGAQLFVPAGKWLTGSFSLTSHFTLYLHKDAVLLASQVSFYFFIFLIIDTQTCMPFMLLNLL